MGDGVTFPRSWNAPPELARDRPRSVRLTAAGIVLSSLSVLMLVGALPVVAAMRVADARTGARAEALRREGQEVVAEVTRLRRTGKDKQPRVAYAFVVGAERYQADVEAPLSRWSVLHVGSPIGAVSPVRPRRQSPAQWEKSPSG